MSGEVHFSRKRVLQKVFRPTQNGLDMTVFEKEGGSFPLEEADFRELMLLLFEGYGRHMRAKEKR